MPRKTTFNDPSRQIVQTSEDQHKYDTPTFRKTYVNAQPVNTYVTPAYTEQANTLAAAFVEAAPGLGMLQQSVMKQYHEEAYTKGEAARLAEGNIDPKDSKELGFFTSPAFQRGYMSLAGAQSGQEAAEQLKADWDTDATRNSMPTQEWIAGWMKKNSPGATDGSYLEGFNRQVIPVANSLIGQGVKEKLDLTRAAVNEKVTGVIRGAINQGWNNDVAAQIKADLQGDGTPEKPGIVGMSNGDWDKEVLTQVNQYIEGGGDPEKARQALKWTKEKRPDGTPGIYYKPGMAKVVDDLMDKAYSVSIQKDNLNEAMDKVGRGDDQRAAKDQVLGLAISGKPQEAIKELNKLRKENPELWTPGVWMRTMERIRNIQHLSKSPGGDGEGGNSPEFSRLVGQAIRGELSTDDIATLVESGKVKPGQSGTLMSYTTRASSLDKAIFKTPAYQRGRGLIEALPSANDVGMEGDYYKQRKAVALAQFDEEVANGASPVDVAEKIHRTEKESFKRGVRVDEYERKYIPKYKTPSEFMQALQQGKVTDPNMIKQETSYWQWLYPPTVPATNKVNK